MGRYEIAELETAAIAAGQASGDIFYRLGLMYSTGGSVETDRVTAHKWFNLAAHARQCRSDPAAPRAGGRDERRRDRHRAARRPRMGQNAVTRTVTETRRCSRRR